LLLNIAAVFSHLSHAQSLPMTFSHPYLGFSVLLIFLSTKLSFQVLVYASVFVQIGLDEPFVPSALYRPSLPREYLCFSREFSESFGVSRFATIFPLWSHGATLVNSDENAQARSKHRESVDIFERPRFMIGVWSCSSIFDREWRTTSDHYLPILERQFKITRRACTTMSPD
jgi:hypothetical protein